MYHQVIAECGVPREAEVPAAWQTDAADRDGILVLDSKDAVIVDSNPFVTEILGYPRERLLGRTLLGTGLLKHSVHGGTLFEKVRREGYVRCPALRMKTCDGRCILVEFVGNAYRVDDRTVVQFNLGKVRDCPPLKWGGCAAASVPPGPACAAQ